MTNDPDLDDCAFLSGKLVVKETARISLILLRCFSMSILMSQVKSVISIKYSFKLCGYIRQDSYMLIETREPKGYKYITLYIIFVNPALRGVFMRKPNTQS